MKMELKDFWYIVAETKELKPNVLLSRKIFDEPIVIFRGDDGTPVAMQDRCVHRSAPLSQGTISNGQLTCPYHGWRYNKEGKVTHIPSEGPQGAARAPKKCVKLYDLVVQDDFIYVRLNSGLDTDLQTKITPFRIPHYKEKGWATIRLQNKFENNVVNCAENFVDIPHTVFVHPTIFRKVKNQKFAANVRRQNGTVVVDYENETSNLGWFSWFLNPKKTEITHVDRFFMPNVTNVEYIFGPKRHFIITSQSIPVSDTETLVYTDLTYNYGMWNWISKPVVNWQAQLIIDQDVRILGQQMENIKKFGQDFSNTQADVIHVLIESIWSELEKGGDPRALPDRSNRIEFWV
jgi:phenylpropionate dioxygenase-like ring-hydroxylating dioxygenase large terminal subunit